MANHNEAAIRTLNGLIKINEDGKAGYKNAAEHIDDQELKTILLRLSQQRSLFEEELKDDIRQLGGEYDIKASGTLLGDAHRAWFDIKSKFVKNDTDAILDECKRGDRSALEAYSKALDNKLPDVVRERLANQVKLVEGTLRQLDEFKHSVH
ncbi:conserved hypothetical protein [Catalinimonas alkaloidigena]|uniref:DUF2383 domain-containing protein n=1 Tax=Catalinimonas alkaloidigena TaxID=1075417 RepID=A0A1G9F7W1_9BACT|nr:PA2169 family four-helix-bundle protein [Catalinimonas alkaloidigena]SDK84440.1 conserved hypothetical protein [Catalinimonas alkaloidigena]